MAVRRRMIRDLANQVLAENAITEAPVEIRKIIDNYGIEVNDGDVDPDLSGFLVRRQGSASAVLGVNKNHHENRQRFTMAHELGHYLLHAGARVHLDSAESGSVAYKVYHRDQTTSTGQDTQEREANLFAAEILMPQGFLMRDIQGLQIDLLDSQSQTLDVLAARYKVSTQALSFRLANLGLVEL